MNPTLHTEVGSDGIMTVRFDRPQRSVNTLTMGVLDELEQQIEAIESGRTLVKGLIFASAKPGDFITGADLYEMAEMDDEAARRFLERGQSLFERVARLKVPTVAAINGHCLGGGMELALACRTRVAVDDSGIRLGFPETKVGLIPAWGGTTRATELLGPIEAIKLLGPGQTLPPRRARNRNLVDELVRPEALMSAARRLAHHPPARPRPPLGLRAAMRIPLLRRRLFDSAHRRTREQTGGHYPAAEALVDVVRVVTESGHRAGLDAERSALVELVDTETTRNLMRLFFLRHDAKQIARDAAPDSPLNVNRAAVIGGGVMGAGITHALICAGVSVRLVEVDASAASAALARIQRMLEDDRRGGRLTALEAERAMRRVSPTYQWTGLGLADVVIEAVAEKMPVKRDVFEKLGHLTRKETVLATNTSALDITEMAGASERPQRVIGLHFFNPVPKMPLLEIVRTPASDGPSVATGVSLALRIGKTPIVVNHGPGFLVNRLILPYLAEAVHAVSEGVSPVELDRAMRDWGMPMGPCELLDHVGLDVTVDILHALQPRLGERLAPPDGLAQAVEERGWLGRKSGKGFYVYPSGWRRTLRREPQVNEALLRRLRDQRTAEAESPGDEARMQRRLVLPMVNEAARVLLEGITDSTDTIDLATVLGLGLAPFRGGLARHAQTVGLGEIVNQLDELAQRHGSRFEPVPELRRIAERGQAMQELVRMRPATGVESRGEDVAQPPRRE